MPLAAACSPGVPVMCFGLRISEPNRQSCGVVVNIRVPSWALTLIRHLIFRVPKKGP